MYIYLLRKLFTLLALSSWRIQLVSAQPSSCGPGRIIQDPAMAGTYIDGCTPDAGKDFVANGMSAFVRIRPISAPSGLNSSPQFVDQDTILFVAKDSLFSNQISAIDPDGDSLAYHFSRPYTFNLNWICGLSGPCRQAPASRWT